MFTDTRRVASKPTRRQLAAIDRQVEAMYYRIASGVQIDVMDIGKVFDAGRTAIAAGEDLEAALRAIVAQLRRN
jgi:hypothetical protein